MTLKNTTTSRPAGDGKPTSFLQRSAPIAAACSTVPALAASALALWSGPGADYAEIFPPPWLGTVGAVLLAVALLTRATGREAVAHAAAWTSSAVLLGASGGVLLDAFRGFFAVTGIPAGTFSEIDLPGAVARAAALIASFTAVQLARRIRAETGSARGVASGRRRRRLRALGLLLCVPYPLLKLAWWAQGDESAYAVGFPVMEIVLFGAAAVGIIVLTAPSIRVLPRGLVAAAGWSAAFALLSMGALMVFGVLAQVTHLAAATLTFDDGDRTVLVMGVYGTWLLLGATLAAATVRYEEGVPAAPDGDRMIDAKGRRG